MDTSLSSEEEDHGMKGEADTKEEDCVIKDGTNGQDCAMKDEIGDEEEASGTMQDDNFDIPQEYAENGLYEIDLNTGTFRINFGSPRSPLTKEENRKWAENTYFVRDVGAVTRVTGILAKSGFFGGLETGKGSAIVPTSPLMHLLIDRESKAGEPLVTTVLQQLMALATVEKMLHAQLLSTPSDRFPELQGPKAVQQKVEFLAKRQSAELMNLNLWWIDQTNEFLSSVEVGQINGSGDGPDAKTTSIIIAHWERLSYAYWVRRINLLEVSLIRFLQLQNASPSHLLVPSIPMEETHRLLKLLPRSQEVVEKCLMELYIIVSQLASHSKGAIVTPVKGDSYESLMLRCVLAERIERMDPAFQQYVEKMRQQATISV